MAGLDGVSVRPDAPVFLQVAAVRQGLLHLRPFLGAEDIRLGAENLLDEDHGAVRRACLDMAALIPEALRLPALTAWAFGKLAVHVQRPADAALARLALALVLFPERPAWADGSEERRASRRAVAAPYKPDAAPFAA
jgi:hypothetical protein